MLSVSGALYLDGGLDVAERIFGDILFDDEHKLNIVWRNLPPHPLQVRVLVFYKKLRATPLII